MGQRNSYVKTWGCGGFLNFSEIANILGSKPGTIFTMLRDSGGIKPHE
ncbi:IS30 family transposase, partial [Escherichia coli]|nr:IS30 family transposase [Escherichia coli]